jgi:hypothetical protein
MGSERSDRDTPGFGPIRKPGVARRIQIVRVLSENCFLQGPTRPKSESEKPAILLDPVGPSWC